MTKTYPLKLREVKPADNFTVLEVPEGEAFHTGGLFLSPDKKEVWKPLDVMPYPNAECRIESRELEVLELMKGQPGFPHNWRVEKANDRKFLVRRFCHVIGERISYKVMGLSQILEIEQWLRNLNSQYWEIHDHLTVAYDRAIDAFFILDLSAAQPMGNSKSVNSIYVANDTSYFYAFAKKCGYETLVNLRWAAKHLTNSIEWLKMELDENSPITDKHRHVYASKNRPINGMWCKIDGALFFDADKRETGVWSWVVTPEVLSEETLKRYELTLGYSPIPYKI